MSFVTAGKALEHRLGRPVPGLSMLAFVAPLAGVSPGGGRIRAKIIGRVLNEQLTTGFSGVVSAPVSAVFVLNEL